MKPKAKKTTHDNMLSELLSITEALEARKALYDELDRLTLALREAGFSHAFFKGKEIILKDNFAEKNVQWRMAAVRRYEATVKDIKGAAERAKPEASDAVRPEASHPAAQNAGAKPQPLTTRQPKRKAAQKVG